MDIIHGLFKLDKGVPKLHIDLPQDLYQKFKNYVSTNMFLACRKMAPEFKTILINSVGDTLDEHGMQNAFKSEIWMYTYADRAPTKKTKSLLESMNYWIILLKNNGSKLEVKIDKSSGEIIERAEFSGKKNNE